MLFLCQFVYNILCLLSLLFRQFPTLKKYPSIIYVLGRGWGVHGYEDAYRRHYCKEDPLELKIPDTGAGNQMLSSAKAVSTLNCLVILPVPVKKRMKRLFNLSFVKIRISNGQLNSRRDVTSLGAKVFRAYSKALPSAIL